MLHIWKKALEVKEGTKPFNKKGQGFQTSTPSKKNDIEDDLEIEQDEEVDYGAPQ